MLLHNRSCDKFRNVQEEESLAAMHLVIMAAMGYDPGP